MADTLKVLGQAALSATTLTDVYTVPALTQATVSSVTVCNQGNTSTTFRISIAVAGAADNAKQYTHYDVSIPANDTFIATVGFTLGAADVVRFYAGNGNLSAGVFGVQVA